MNRPVFLLLLCFLGIRPTAAQSVRIDPDNATLSIVAYNADIRLHTTTSDSIRVTGGPLPRQSGEAWILDTLSSGERLALDIHVPGHVPVEAKIQREGSFHAFERSGALSVEIYSGPVTFTHVQGPITVETIREGDIVVDYARPPAHPLVATSFHGSIRVGPTDGAPIRIQMRSDLGDIRPGPFLDLFERVPAGSFERVDHGVRTMHDATWLRWIPEQAVTSMLLYTVHGDIELN